MQNKPERRWVMEDVSIEREAKICAHIPNEDLMVCHQHLLAPPYLSQSHFISSIPSATRFIQTKKLSNVVQIFLGGEVVGVESRYHVAMPMLSPHLPSSQASQIHHRLEEGSPSK